MLSVVQNDDQKLIIQNNDGFWLIFKQYQAAQKGIASPGHIAQFLLGNHLDWKNTNDLMTDELRFQSRDPETGNIVTTINDTRFGGLGAFGVHVRREGGRAYDLTARRLWEWGGHYGLKSCSVQVFDVSPRVIHVHALITLAIEGDELFHLNYLYEFKPDCVNCILTVVEAWNGNGFQWYAKEPKVTFKMLHKPYQARVFAKAGKLLRTFDLLPIRDPHRHTQQVRADSRCRISFDGKKVFNIVGEAWNGHQPVRWKPSKYGFDGWALRGNAALKHAMGYEPMKSDQKYCLQGKGETLSRNWEISRWEEYEGVTSLTLHAWEGGAGYGDCWCAGIPMSVGGSHSIYFSLSVGKGYEV